MQLLTQQAKQALKKWQEEGVRPLEVAPERLVQSVKVSHDLTTGKLTWSSERVNEQTVGLLLMAAWSAYQYWFAAPDRPERPQGDTAVMVASNAETLVIAVEPEGDRVHATALLAAALFELLEDEAVLASFAEMMGMTGE